MARKNLTEAPPQRDVRPPPSWLRANGNVLPPEGEGAPGPPPPPSWIGPPRGRSGPGTRRSGTRPRNANANSNRPASQGRQPPAPPSWIGPPRRRGNANSDRRDTGVNYVEQVVPPANNEYWNQGPPASGRNRELVTRHHGHTQPGEPQPLGFAQETTTVQKRSSTENRRRRSARYTDGTHDLVTSSPRETREHATSHHAQRNTSATRQTSRSETTKTNLPYGTQTITTAYLDPSRAIAFLVDALEYSVGPGREHKTDMETLQIFEELLRPLKRFFGNLNYRKNKITDWAPAVNLIGAHTGWEWQKCVNLIIAMGVRCLQCVDLCTETWTRRFDIRHPDDREYARKVILPRVIYEAYQIMREGLPGRVPADLEIEAGDGGVRVSAVIGEDELPLTTDPNGGVKVSEWGKRTRPRTRQDDERGGETELERWETYTGRGRDTGTGTRQGTEIWKPIGEAEWWELRQRKRELQEARDRREWITKEVTKEMESKWIREEVAKEMKRERIREEVKRRLDDEEAARRVLRERRRLEEDRARRVQRLEWEEREKERWHTEAVLASERLRALARETEQAERDYERAINRSAADIPTRQAYTLPLGATDEESVMSYDGAETLNKASRLLDRLRGPPRASWGNGTGRDDIRHRTGYDPTDLSRPRPTAEPRPHFWTEYTGGNYQPTYDSVY